MAWPAAVSHSHRAPEPRVEVGLAHRQHAELERAAGPHHALDGARLEPILGARVQVRAAGHRHRPEAGRAARRDRARRSLALTAECGPRTVAVAGQPRDRRVDNAEHGTALIDEADVDAELAVAVQVLARAVEGIDKPEAAAGDIRDHSRRHAFLRNYRDLRRQAPQTLEHDPLGSDVGGGDRRAVGLDAHGLRLAVVTQDHLAPHPLPAR